MRPKPHHDAPTDRQHSFGMWSDNCARCGATLAQAEGGKACITDAEWKDKQDLSKVMGRLRAQADR